MEHVLFSLLSKQLVLSENNQDSDCPYFPTYENQAKGKKNNGLKCMVTGDISTLGPFYAISEPNDMPWFWSEQ